jgi:hypothetical protein
MRRHAWFTLFCAAAFAVAGCSGGGGSGPGIPAGSQAAAKKGIFALRVMVPRPARHGHGRGAKYISPATTSMAMTITGPTIVNVSVPLNPTTCQATLANLVCNQTQALKPGAYTATVTLYDAGAKVLSSGQSLSFTITAGTVNNVVLTLSGVARTLLVSSSSPLAHTNASGGIDLLAVGSHSLFVTAEDADGYIIVGPGAPSYTVAKTSGSLGVALTQPLAQSPNAFGVTPPSAFSSSTATLTITAKYAAPLSNACTQVGAVCSTAVVVGMGELFAVDTGGSVLVYQLGQTAPIADVSIGFNDSEAVAFDPSGNLYVANCAIGCGNGTSVDAVLEFAPPYNGVPTYLFDGVKAPQALAVSGTGELFVANCGSCRLGTSDSVTAYAQPISASSSPVATMTGVFDPQALLVNAAGDVFIASCGQCTGANLDSVQEFAPPFTGPPAATITTAINGPDSMTLDASNRL